MRGVIALVCVFVLGFAPVPFPKSKAQYKANITLDELVGVWQDAPDTLPRDAVVRPGNVWTITFAPTTWTFGPNPYEVRLNRWKNPAEFDLYRAGQATPFGRGVIRRDGERLVLAYAWGGTRPTGLEKPTRGFVRTLVRVGKK